MLLLLAAVLLAHVATAPATSTDDNVISVKPFYETSFLPDLLPGERVRPGPQWRWGNWAIGRTGVVAGNAEPAGWFWVRWDNEMVNAYRFYDGARDLEPLPAQPQPVVRSVWPGSAASVAAGDAPLILTDTPADTWQAHAWTPAWLVEHVKTPLLGVKVAPRGKGGDGTFFHYFHSSPMAEVPALAAPARARAYTRANMTMREFLMQAGMLPSGLGAAEESAFDDHGLHIPSLEHARLREGANTTHAFAYAAMLHDWGLDFARQTLPLHPFLVLPPTVDPTRDNEYRQTRVWISPAHAHTPGHFDLFHNFYVQLHGRKRFLLWPPETAGYIYLHPVLHPCGRASQVDLLRGTRTANFPLFHPDRIAPFVADLGPGDVLYIPPLWIHHVSALTDSVSVSIWSLYDATETAAKVAETVVLPVARTWPAELKTAALRLYLTDLIAAVQSLSAKDFVRTEILETRYLHQPCVPDPIYCNNGAAANAVKKQGAHLMQQQLQAAIAIFQRTRLEGTEARLPIYLSDYVEIATNSIVGPERVCSFLSALVSC